MMIAPAPQVCLNLVAISRRMSPLHKAPDLPVNVVRAPPPSVHVPRGSGRKTALVYYHIYFDDAAAVMAHNDRGLSMGGAESVAGSTATYKLLCSGLATHIIHAWVTEVPREYVEFLVPMSDCTGLCVVAPAPSSPSFACPPSVRVSDLVITHSNEKKRNKTNPLTRLRGVSSPSSPLAKIVLRGELPVRPRGSQWQPLFGSGIVPRARDCERCAPTMSCLSVHHVPSTRPNHRPKQRDATHFGARRTPKLMDSP